MAKKARAINASAQAASAGTLTAPGGTGIVPAPGHAAPPVPVGDEETFAIIEPGHTYGSISQKISEIILHGNLWTGWLVGLAMTVSLLLLMLTALSMVILQGVGMWGINIPVGWGFDIISFVWWIGIGHAGTLISAILLLFHQNWRTSINRFAEAMTIFAVMCAGMYPLLHLGRHQYAYWMFPVPNTMQLWPQFRSPLIWDVFAVSTYFTVSATFWYVGLIPDLATLRDRATNRFAKIIYGVFALGWRGSAKHWHRYTAIYLLLAAISTPLVLSVHSVISFDFSVGIVPGWHSTIFPPYFVAGAIFAGFAFVLILAIPMRALCNLRDVITMKHLENCGKVMLATGMVVFYGYLMELFMGYFSRNTYEQYMTTNRMVGPYGPSYWALFFCNGFAPQILWFRKMRTNIPCLFIVSLIVSVGMFLERFVIIVVSLHRDYLPAAWGMYYPTFWDWAQFIGSIGLFSTLFLLFVRVLPSISMAEVRELVHHEGHTAGAGEVAYEEAETSGDGQTTGSNLKPRPAQA
ncbi:MAG: polysulfide reductase NrfD [Abitibacteriaceae bacterium]|nr:polysulfide reductase NrfD [Abditibacteriaceae bacterium]MBV9865536.1 polysulfide reductase NrfD [Abditibacteriaceae bacterium]